MGEFSQSERLAPRWTAPEGAEMVEDSERVEEFAAVVRVKTAIYREPFEVTEPGAMLKGIKVMQRAVEDPGEGVDLENQYPFEAIHGRELVEGVCCMNGVFFDVGGLSFLADRTPANGEWNTLPVRVSRKGDILGRELTTAQALRLLSSADQDRVETAFAEDAGDDLRSAWISDRVTYLALLPATGKAEVLDAMARSDLLPVIQLEHTTNGLILDIANQALNEAAGRCTFAELLEITEVMSCAS